MSYLALFEHLRAARSLPPSDLSFAALAGLEVRPEDLGLAFSDE